MIGSRDGKKCKVVVGFHVFTGIVSNNRMYSCIYMYIHTYCMCIYIYLMCCGLLSLVDCEHVSTLPLICVFRPLFGGLCALRCCRTAPIKLGCVYRFPFLGTKQLLFGKIGQ